MTDPTDRPTPPAGDDIQQDQEWQEKQDTIRGLFGTGGSSPVAVSPALSPHEQEQEWATNELHVLETESPAVAREVEVATEIPEADDPPVVALDQPEPQIADSLTVESPSAAEKAEVEVIPEVVPVESPPSTPEAVSVEEVGPPASAPAPVDQLASTPVEPSTAEATASVPVSSEPSTGAMDNVGISNDLEEQVYAPTVIAQGPKVGDVVDGYQLNEDLGRGWFTANPTASGPSVDVYARPNPLWAGLKPHRMLPKAVPVGALTVLEPSGGLPVQAPLNPVVARRHITELARLLFALEKQGYAVTDLDPHSILLTADGLKLRLPPKVARLGERAEPTLRDGFTPPEIHQEHQADAKSGVYLLGALLYQWLSGQMLPPEGPSPIVLAGLRTPGMPQLLNQMLAPLASRLTPSELLDVLKTDTTAALPAYQIAAATNVGLNPERPVNEDSYGFVWRQVGMHAQDSVVLRACVSDGMGGMAAGEVASQAAVRAFLNSVQPNMEAMIWEANAAVLTDMQGRDGGCTISAVEIMGSKLQMGHVGDTRAYATFGEKVEQLSKDHSYVAAMVASGQMTPEEAQVSPERNKVLRSLGSVRVPQPSYVQTLAEPLEMQLGQRILMVSDGVWGEVEPATLHEILLHEKDLQRLVDRLLELSLEAGAPDNITALVIERVK